MFFKTKSTKKGEYIEKVRQAAKKLRQGEQNNLAVIYQALASMDEDVIRCAATEIAQYMQSLDSNQILRLDESFREYSSMEWYICWKETELNFWKKSIKSREEYLWVLRLGTFHPNGFFREKCIYELAQDNGSVRFVLLRLNDWAAPVREAAKAVSIHITELNVEELIVCLPYLEKVRRGSRRENNILYELEECVGNRIERQLKDIDLRNLKKYDLKARKYLYRLLLERKLLTKQEINKVLYCEKNSQCQFGIITLLLKEYECSLEELDSYLQHRSKVVQRKALEQKYSILGTYWEGLEKMLLASSLGVRSQVCYILRKHTDFDIVAYYVKHLETPYKRICILGIGENGSAEDVRLLLRYLEESEEGIVKSTLHAVSKLAGADAQEIFWKYLQDERPVVLRAAYREIAANNINFGAKQVYDLFIKTESQLLREKLAYLLLKEYSWDRLPYILKLYWYDEENVRKVLQRGVEGRSMYGQISKEDAEVIRSILYNEKYRIPQVLQKSIEFDLKFVVIGEKGTDK